MKTDKKTNSVLNLKCVFGKPVFFLKTKRQKDIQTDKKTNSVLNLPGVCVW